MRPLRWWALAGAAWGVVFALWVWVGYKAMILLGEVLK